MTEAQPKGTLDGAIEVLEDNIKRLKAFISDDHETCDVCGMNPGFANDFCEAGVDKTAEALAQLMQGCSRLF